MTTLTPPSPVEASAASDPSGRGGPARSPRGPKPPFFGDRSQRRSLLRSLLLVAATVLLPGSAQWYAGSRRIGTIALRVIAGILVLAVLFVGLGWLRPEWAVALVTNSVVLTVLRVAILVLGVGWLYLVLDAWRIAAPLSLARGGRLVLFGTTAAAFLLVAAIISGSANLMQVFKDSLGTIFSSRAAIGTVDGRYNVLLVGGDAGKTRVGLRPDSLTVVSVDAESGRTALIGIPRNLQDVPFPADTPLAERFPNGYDCGDECLVNALYTFGQEHVELLPGAEDPGMEATRLAAEGVTGLSIPSTVMVDMRGFQQLVDAVGGVSVDVGKPVEMVAPGTPSLGTIETGVQRLDGTQALWFARSRTGSSDYERMARQKCLTASLARQLSPVTVLRNFEALATASSALLRSDIPQSDIPGMLRVAQVAQGQPMDAVSLVPPLVEPSQPDFTEIQAIVERVLAGEPADGQPAESTATGDGGVGNSGSSAEAAQTGSVPARSTENDGAESAVSGAAGKKGQQGAPSAAELGLVCRAV